VNFILIGVAVYAVAKFAGIPEPLATGISVVAGAVEAIANLERWTTAYNAAKLKKVIHE
jgi:hypothetical protein